MSITHFLTTTAIIKRLGTVSGYRKNLIATMTVDMHIQDAQDIENAAYYASFQATHIGFVDENTNIQKKDRIVLTDGTQYDVVNVLSKEYDFAMNPHVELILKVIDG